MCGIVGFSLNVNNAHFIDRRKYFNEVFLNDAIIKLSHRGPDDGGLFLNEDRSVGLGHRRLSIMDLSPLGHQPMFSRDGDVSLIFNGEIYNFEELRSELLDKGYNFEGNSDTEVLLNLYLAEGKLMLSRLNGIFSFAIWDKRINKMFLARDSFGVKPLYYYCFDGVFIFASEVKAMIPLLPEPLSINEISLHRYLSFIWCPGPDYALKEVKKLLPGEAIEVQCGKIIDRWTWYKLPITRPISYIHKKEEAILGIVSHLRAAVKRQMVADVPVGAFLSGGLDSSAIVAFAKEINPNIRCFTIKTLGNNSREMVDDLPYALVVAKHLQVSLDVVEVDSQRMMNDLERMIIQMDEPIADPAALNAMYICELARDQGVKVLLSGVGGDDLFTGYRRHLAAKTGNITGLIPFTVRNFLAKNSVNLDQRNLLSRRVSKFLNGFELSGDERLVNYFKWASEEQLLSLYTADFREIVGKELASKPLLEFLKEVPTGVTSLEKMLGLEQKYFLADHNLIYTDKMSMAAGVEVRVPFLDLDLVEFASRIPINMKQRFYIGKWILKKAMEPYLPREIIYRPKTGFGSPLRHWMRHDLREMVADILSTKSLTNRGIFDPVAVHKLVLDNDLGKQDASYILFSLMCIEIWCRNFIDSGVMRGSNEYRQTKGA